MSRESQRMILPGELKSFIEVSAPIIQLLSISFAAFQAPHEFLVCLTKQESDAFLSGDHDAAKCKDYREMSMSVRDYL